MAQPFSGINKHQTEPHIKLTSQTSHLMGTRVGVIYDGNAHPGNFIKGHAVDKFIFVLRLLNTIKTCKTFRINDYFKKPILNVMYSLLYLKIVFLLSFWISLNVCTLWRMRVRRIRFFLQLGSPHSIMFEANVGLLNVTHIK
jgi:hypothetical protein